MASRAKIITSGAVMATKSSKPSQLPMLVTGKHNSSSKSKGPSNGGKCTHCGNTKHTRDTCFKLHVYPEWWHELQAKKKRDTTTLEEGTGKAAIVMAESQLSLIPLTILPFLWTKVIVDKFSVVLILKIQVHGL